MKIAIVTKIGNGKGLQRDYEILGDLLRARGHEVSGHHHRYGTPKGCADLVIFLETCESRLFAMAPRRWLIPNPEWWDRSWTGLLKHVDLVLCKTRDAERIFRKLAQRVAYLGFTSRDQMLGDVIRERRYLHVQGGSNLKGTEGILAAWRNHRLELPLTVVSRYRISVNNPNVVIRQRLSPEDLQEVQNRHVFHLCPSRYEGWGHHIHEGLSVGAVVVVTDHPPMCELGGCTVQIAGPHDSMTQGLATMARVKARQLVTAVHECQTMSEERIAKQRRAARLHFERERSEFVTTLDRILELECPS
jgi:hypothetical protein